jgi:hypothetical protein
VLTKHHYKTNLISLVRTIIKCKTNEAILLINDRYNHFIEKLFLDDELVIEKFPVEGLECGATFEWKFQPNEADLYVNIDSDQDDDANLLTRIRRSIHLYMELDTLDPDEDYHSSYIPEKELVVKDQSSSERNRVHLFRLSRWNIIRLYFKNIFRAICIGARKVKSILIDGVFFARLYLPISIFEMKIRGPSQRC